MLLFFKVNAKLLCTFRTWLVEFESLLFQKVNMVCYLFPLSFTPSRIFLVLCFLLESMKAEFSADAQQEKPGTLCLELLFTVRDQISH